MYEQKEPDREEYDEEELGEVIAQLALQSQHAIFDKPSQQRHLKALYMKGLVDGGVVVNLMPYTMFRKLGKSPRDLLETDIMLKDFRGNASKTRGLLTSN